MNRQSGTTLRVALLSDTHGFIDPRIDRIVSQCDIAVHAGDIGGLEVLARLRPRTGRIVAVRGNNDNLSEWPPTDLESLAAIRRVAELTLPGGSLAVIHGHRSGPLYERHRRLRARFPHARAVVVGHSHRQACDYDGEPWILNPGAAGCYRTYGRPGCLVLSISDRGWSIGVHTLGPLRRPLRRDGQPGKGRFAAASHP